MVSPSTGLTNGQVISVSATGYPASASGAILECNNSTPQPTVTLAGNAIPVSCGDPFLTLETTDTSGNLAATPFTVSTGTVGPPSAITDSDGNPAASDAANFPCPPTAAQIGDGFSCVIAFGVQGEATTPTPVPISFSGESSGTTTTTTTSGTTTTTTTSGTTTTTTSAGTTTTTSASGTTTTTVPCTAKSTMSTAAGPSLTADPGTCLNGGSVVTVTGSGFDNGSAGAILECNNATSQPTVALGSPINQSVPVSCTGIEAAGLITTTSSGAISTKFTIAAGTTGPPCGGSYLISKCPATDSTGGSPTTDAAKYPCPPTAAQLAAGVSCALAFGDAGGKQATVDIAFVPAPTPSAPAGSTSATSATSASVTGASTAAAGNTTATSAPSTSASTLAFTGAGPGLWFTLLAGLLLLDLGYLVLTTFYRPREFATRLRRLARDMFEGE